MSRSDFDPKRISCLAEALASYPIIAAYLYGSVATKRTTPFSDVDIALVVNESALSKVNRLKFELEIEDKIARYCEISNADVRVINDAPIVIRGEVVSNGVLIFCQDEDARVEFETRARSEYFDFLPIAEMIRESHFETILERGLDGQRSKDRWPAA